MKVGLSIMTTEDEDLVTRAVALCFKPFLKPYEAQVYCGLRHSHFARKCEEYGIYKNESGYFAKADLDKMLQGKQSKA